ncbi:CRTAC1 family protein [Mariniflexile sp. AS56]|uniref:CRTAC1 family protein n=1 Tax=Mariniflexile sp. AS56 TaxID=3063957 RepID=UPI0026EB2780|nr:CRTAC1 family protein [Mariniflexile sp. AS56]MDO7173111.1 CRTAC1 family protein [Mariniflexile sp. AS56]
MKNNTQIHISLLITVVLICFAISFGNAQATNTSNSKDFFNEVTKEFPKQEKNLRKWDAPVVADLDQDGYQDLLINDHGFGIQVCWNNNGKFEKPYDLIMGDLHGVAVGDFDFDGNLEVIMSRGGGSGSNARNSKTFRVTKNREFIALPDFNVPLELMRGRTLQFLDGDNDGDLDLLNFAFPGAEKNGESENYVYKNNGNGELILHSTLPAVKADGQKTLVTDFNNDAVFDLVMYGNGPVKAFKGNGDLTFTDVSKEVLPYDIKDVTGIAEIDFDNDGDLDLYFTRGNGFEIGETFFDNETKTLGFFTKRGEFNFEMPVGDVLKLENMQSQWPNADTYYIGEASYDYTFEGETHTGKDIKLVNSNAFGFPDNTNFKDKSGWYIGYIGNKKWRIAGYLSAPSTGIVHGVEDYPKYNHPKELSDILLENKERKLVDVTKEQHVFETSNNEGVTIADFDNNGYQDILIVKRGNLIHANESIIFLNKGKSGFEKLTNHQIISKELGAIGMAVETIDYNQDGKIDVVLGNERGLWHLFKNELAEAGNNHFITIEVGNSNSGKVTALGAKVEVKSCKNTQIQRVGSTGAQYSQGLNNFMNFGLGTCKEAVKVKVTYTNGETIEKSITTLNTKVLIGKNN